MTDTPETLARQFYEPLGNGNLSLLDAILSPDWEGVPAMQTGPGPDGWKQAIEHLRTAVVDMQVDIEQVVVAGDLVAVRSTGRGKHVGSLMGVEGTGQDVVFRSADFHQVADGKIVRTWHLEDFFGLAMQLGLELSRAA